MVVSSARHCVACADPVQGSMNGDILCNDCLAFQMAAGFTPSTKRCPMCDTDIPKARDLCDVCIETLKDSSILKRRKTDNLKLFEVTVYPHPAAGATVRNAHVLLLAKGVESAELAALYQLGMADPGGRIRMSTREITGPFRDGFILHAQDSNV